MKEYYYKICGRKVSRKKYKKYEVILCKDCHKLEYNFISIGER